MLTRWRHPENKFTNHFTVCPVNLSVVSENVSDQLAVSWVGCCLVLCPSTYLGTYLCNIAQLSLSFVGCCRPIKYHPLNPPRKIGLKAGCPFALQLCATYILTGAVARVLRQQEHISRFVISHRHRKRWASSFGEKSKTHNLGRVGIISFGTVAERAAPSHSALLSSCSHSTLAIGLSGPWK